MDRDFKFIVNDLWASCTIFNDSIRPNNFTHINSPTIFLIFLIILQNLEKANISAYSIKIVDLVFTQTCYVARVSEGSSNINKKSLWLFLIKLQQTLKIENIKNTYCVIFPFFLLFSKTKSRKIKIQPPQYIN